MQGCSIGCVGCVSKDTWDAGGGWDVHVEDILDWCDAGLGRGIDGLTISGGEPFEQPQALARLLELVDAWCRQVEGPFDILCYSGLPLASIERHYQGILGLLDVLIPEPYRVGRAIGGAEPGRWRGSSNQPLVPLTRLGRVRYGGVAQRANGAPHIQLSVEGGAAWFIGIPKAGDMDRLEERVRARGVIMEDVSWRA